jgi:hypothetical protein
MLRRAGIAIGRAATAPRGLDRAAARDHVGVAPARDAGDQRRRTRQPEPPLLALSRPRRPGPLLARGCVAFPTERPLKRVGQASVSVHKRSAAAVRIPSLGRSWSSGEASSGSRSVSAGLHALSAAGNPGLEYLALLCTLRAVSARATPLPHPHRCRSVRIDDEMGGVEQTAEGLANVVITVQPLPTRFRST